MTPELTINEPTVADRSKTSDDFVGLAVFRRRSALYLKLALYGLGTGLFSTFTGLSYFSGDSYNTIYYFFAPVALYFLVVLARAFRQVFKPRTEIQIDASGFRIYQPDLLHWPWSVIKSVSSQENTITLELTTSGSYDQGVWDRTEVIFSTAALDHDVQIIETTIEQGIKRFNPPTG